MRRFHFIILLAVVVIMSTAGPGVAVSAGDDSAHGAMVTCPLMPGGAVAMCGMEGAEHVAHWQSMFVATIAGGAGTLLMFLVVFAIVTAAVVVFLSLQRAHARFVFYERLRHVMALFLPLRFALARGIVHPKRERRIS